MKNILKSLILLLTVSYSSVHASGEKFTLPRLFNVCENFHIKYSKKRAVDELPPNAITYATTSRWYVLTKVGSKFRVVSYADEEFKIVVGMFSYDSDRYYSYSSMTNAVSSNVDVNNLIGFTKHMLSSSPFGFLATRGEIKSLESDSSKDKAHTTTLSADGFFKFSISVEKYEGFPIEQLVKKSIVKRYFGEKKESLDKLSSYSIDLIDFKILPKDEAAMFDNSYFRIDDFLIEGQ